MAIANKNSFDPDIVESISNAENNTISIRNVSYQLNYMNKFIMDEPQTIVQRYSEVLLGNLRAIEFPSGNYKYRPNALSEKIYGTPDLWYLIMMANSWTRFEQVLPSKKGLMKIIPTATVNDFLRILLEHEDAIAENHVTPPNVEAELIPVTIIE